MLIRGKYYCPGCMKQLYNEYTVCDCGYDSGNNRRISYHLPEGTILEDIYLIGKVIGEGGFGITYIGWDLNLERKIAIKEFYMQGYSGRDVSVSHDLYAIGESHEAIFKKYKERFINEAKILAKFSKEGGIVSVHTFLRANNTAYIIMEYLDGMELKKYISKFGKIPAEETVRILFPVMNSLKKMHSGGYIHRDISLDNIMFTDEGTVKLLDFGSARESEQSTKSIIVKHGYAPIEQYEEHGNQGPWTDIYSLCATMYACISGVEPYTAISRMSRDKLIPLSEKEPSCSEKISRVIMKGMSIYYEDRYKSIDELQVALIDAVNNSGYIGENLVAEDQDAENQGTEDQGAEALTVEKIYSEDVASENFDEDIINIEISDEEISDIEQNIAEGMKVLPDEDNATFVNDTDSYGFADPYSGRLQNENVEKKDDKNVRKIITAIIIAILAIVAVALTISAIERLRNQSKPGSDPAGSTEQGSDITGDPSPGPSEEPRPEADGETETYDIEASINEIKSKTPGELVKFGKYEQNNVTDDGKEDIEWIVLSQDDEKAVLLSKYALDRQPYNDKDAEVSWKESSLRKWLNKEFIEEAFSEEERTYLSDYSDNPEEIVCLLDKKDYPVYKELYLEGGACEATEYAKANGCQTKLLTGNEKCEWYVGNFFTYSNEAEIVSVSKEISKEKVNTAGVGIRPMLVVNYEKHEKNYKKEISELEIGDSFLFGSIIQDPEKDTTDPIEWLVIEKKDSVVTLISKDVIWADCFGESDGWKNSDIRKWLNGDFYLNTFSDEEKEYITCREVEASKYNDGNMSDIDKTTKSTFDYVYLLSNSEWKKLFDTKEKQKYRASEAAIRKGDCHYMLLRTSSYNVAEAVSYNDFTGTCSFSYACGIRPVIRLENPKTVNNANRVAKYMGFLDGDLTAHSDETNQELSIGKLFANNDTTYIYQFIDLNGDENDELIIKRDDFFYILTIRDDKLVILNLPYAPGFKGSITDTSKIVSSITSPEGLTVNQVYEFNGEGIVLDKTLRNIGDIYQELAADGITYVNIEQYQYLRYMGETVKLDAHWDER